MPTSENRKIYLHSLIDFRYFCWPPVYMAYIHLSITGSVNLDTKQNSQGAANTWTTFLSGKSTWLPISIYSQGLSETWLPQPTSPSTALPLIPLLSQVWLPVSTKAWLSLPSWTLPHTVLGSSWPPVFWYRVIHAKMFKEKKWKGRYI